GVDPHHVVVHVLVLLSGVVERLAAVGRDLEEGVDGEDRAHLGGVRKELLVVLRAARDGAAALLPTGAGVGRAVEAAALPRLDGGVDHVGGDGGDGEADAPHLFLRQAGGELAPGGAAVTALVDRRAGAAVDQRPDLALPLIGGGIEDVGVARVHRQVGDAGVLVDREDRFPGLAAVGGLVEAAVAARIPQRALGRDEDHVRIARIDDDLPNVLGALETHIDPGLAAVDRLVDAVPIRDAALAVVLAAAHPDHGRVVGVD